MPCSLDIVTVNWNSGKQLTRCLESIETTCKAGFTLQRVVVVDNASRDGSADGLERLDLPLTVIRNPDNRGFGRACNQGAAESQADYLLFLNPDSCLFEGSLGEPLAFLQRPENARVGIAGIQLVDDEGRVSRDCARFPGVGDFMLAVSRLGPLLPKRFRYLEMREWDHGDTRPVDHVKGAFYLTRRCVFEALGGFDERFFMYMEDLDFSLRASRLGWQCVYLAEPRAGHRGGGTSRQVKAACLFYDLRSRIQYVYKHHPWPGATAHLLGTLAVQPLAHMLPQALRPHEFRETLAGYRLLWREAPAMFRAACDGRWETCREPVGPGTAFRSTREPRVPSRIGEPTFETGGSR